MLVWPLLMLFVGAAAVMGVLSTVERRASADAQHANELVQNVALQVSRLQALEWQAIAEGEVSAELSRGVEKARADAERTIGELRAIDPHEGVPISRPYRAYADALARELQLIERGDVTAARRLDEERVDPLFEALEEVVEEELQEHDAIADARVEAADRMSLAALAAAAAVVGLLVWQFSVQRRTVVREREHIEQLQALDRMKDDFVASVSHELRTPLTSIRGYLELVLDREAGELTDEQDHFLRIVDRNADRLLHVVGDLLFAAQVEAGKIALDLERVDLNAVAALAVEAARPQAEERGIQLGFNEEPLPTIAGDPARLAQLLDNLVSNALKFTPAAGRVEVRTRANGGYALLEVEDTGIGIPAEEQEHLFERFFRTATVTEQAIQGTGLGLSISKSIAEAHGGRISLESEEGKGTTFRVELPISEHVRTDADRTGAAA